MIFFPQLLRSHGSERPSVQSHVGAVAPHGGSDVATAGHVTSLPRVASGDFLSAGATLERLTPRGTHKICFAGDAYGQNQRNVSRSSVVIQPHRHTHGGNRNQFWKGGAMGMTHRITVPAVEETADVSAVIAEFYREWRRMVADGIQPHEHPRIENFLHRLRREQHEAAQAIAEADIHMELISGWTRVGGPNEKTIRTLAEEGYEIDDRHRKHEAA